MQAQQLDTRDAGQFKFAAFMDARVKSYAASTGYSEQQRRRAEQIRLGLGLCYSGTVYVTYRKKFIVVKIEQGRVTDAQSLQQLEQDYALEGITKTVTAQGTAYRIPKVDRVSI